MPNPYVAVVIVALELGEDPAHLAARLGEAVIADNIGMRVISRECAAAVIAEHRNRVAAAAAAQRERDEQWRQRLAAMPDPAARVNAIAQAQEQAREAGLFADDATAFAMMCTGDYEHRMGIAGRHFDEYIAAERDGHVGFGRRFTIPNDNQE